MKSKIFILPIALVSLVSCSVSKELNRKSFYFSTFTESRLYEGNKQNLDYIDQILSKIDKLTDNYKARDINNIVTINSTNENVQVEPELNEILQLSFSSELGELKYFNPLCGNLSNLWKNSLKIPEILPQDTINSELLKMQNSHLHFVSENVVKRSGEALLDLGAVAKGYALDKVKNYLAQNNITKYLIDGGSSSILLGEKNNGENFKVKISNLEDSYLLLKNCFVSTSSSSRQQVIIDNKVYSHIINPITGSAINEHDAVIVISDKGYLGDILSTDFVNESLDSIRALEEKFNVKSIVIKDKSIVYKNEALEVVNK